MDVNLKLLREFLWVFFFFLQMWSFKLTELLNVFFTDVEPLSGTLKTKPWFLRTQLWFFHTHRNIAPKSGTIFRLIQKIL